MVEWLVGVVATAEGARRVDVRRPISEVDFSLVPGAARWEAFAAALHFAPSATRARSLRSLPLAALGARLAFPGQGRFASKHRPPGTTKGTR